MNIVGYHVRHAAFGEGEIVGQDDCYVEVRFGDEIYPFQYPYAFEQYLELVDPEAGEMVAKVLQDRLDADARAEQERQADIERRRQNRERNILLSIRAGRRSRRPGDAARRAASRRAGPAFGAAFKLDRDDELPADSSEELAAALSPWNAPAGVIASGQNAGKAIRMKQLKPGHLIALTRRPENATHENERIIYGLAMISDCRQADEDEMPNLSAEPENVFLLDEETSSALLFWNYYANLSNPQNIQWGTGRFRYLSADQTAQILTDLVTLREEQDDGEEIMAFFDRFMTINALDRERIPDNAGALLLEPEDEEDEVEAAQPEADAAAQTQN
ncbi:MAG: hypothetical protein QM296_02275 [Bacillota bacterium]|nr:hypothetical protein [Bacillota bacterium]